jgi:hypothetical protein
MSDFHEVLCGKCKVPLEGPAKPEPESVFSCPSCRASDTHQNVMAEVKDYVTETTAKHLQKRLRSAVAGNKWMKVETKPIPQRSYRFVVNLDL